MTYIEYAEKLGINLNSTQIEILNLIEEHKDERLIINYPRMIGRQMLQNLIQRKKGYEQGRADAIKELLKELCIGCAYLNGTKCEIKGGCPCSIGQSEIIRSANKVLE